MAAKILHSLTEDNPDLQKQIGCMTGIFQLFDRQPILSSKKLPTAGNSHYHDETVEKECNTAEPRFAPEKYLNNNNIQERQRASIESFSSSRSPSFSSLDYNSSNNLEQVPSRMNVQNSSPQSLHLRDVVKDSMYRELQGLPRFKDVHHNEQRELLRSSSYHPKDGSSFWVPKDAPRFSYDEREISYMPYESRDIFKSTQKLKDFPRHSLDSREFDVKVKNVQQASGNHARATSVVAKLMGLETLSDSGDTKSKLQKEAHSLPRGRNPDSSMKHISRFSVESAPKKQIDMNRLSRKPVKPPKAFPSVYSEIEKRLKDLEFAHSGKDLRALKQILEAMQAKGLLETHHHNQGQRHTNDAAMMNSQKFQTYQVRPRADSPTHFESPIIIMKPAKLVQKSAASVISLDGFSGRPKHQGGEFFDNRIRRSAIDKIVTERNFKTAPNAEKSRQLHKEFKKSSDSISPRMLRKKLELEKRSKPLAPPDAIKSRRQSNKQQEESSSPGGLRRTKHPNDGLLIEGRRNFRNLKNEISVQSNGGIMLRSNNVDVRSFSETSPEIIKSPVVDKEFYWMVSGKESRSPPEYPSPVSVLEYTDDSTSPIKHVGKTLKGAEYVDLGNSAEDFVPNSKKLQNINGLVKKLTRLNSSHDETHTDYIASLCENTNPNHRYISDILLASGLLLRELGSSSTNFQFHPSGHPINPELYLVLEQTKASSLHKEDCGAEKTTQFLAKERVHRKLFFDVVNEILARKLALVGPFYEPWLRPNKLAGKALNAQKVLKDLCTEIEELQTKSSKCGSDDDDGLTDILHEDLMHQSENWNNFNGETSGIILDVERLIFKDLVNEVVVGVAAGLKIKQTWRR